MRIACVRNAGSKVLLFFFVAYRILWAGAHIFAWAKYTTGWMSDGQINLLGIWAILFFFFCAMVSYKKCKYVLNAKFRVAWWTIARTDAKLDGKHVFYVYIMFVRMCAKEVMHPIIIRSYLRCIEMRIYAGRDGAMRRVVYHSCVVERCLVRTYPFVRIYLCKRRVIFFSGRQKIVQGLLKFS